MNRVKLEIVSHSFPSMLAPYDATFVRDHAIAFSDIYSPDITIPTPYALPFTSRKAKNKSELICPEVNHINRVNYFSLPGQKLPVLIQNSIARQLTKYLKKINPSLIHIHFLYPSGLAIPKLKKELRCPVVLTIHGTDFYQSLEKKSLRKLLRESVKAADSVITVGPKLERDVKKAFPDATPKIQTIYNFADTSYFYPPDPVKKQQSKKILGLHDSKFQLLCVANFRHKKGIDLLVGAVSALQDKHKFEVHIVGRTDQEPDYQSKVMNRIKREGITNIHIHGPKPRNEIRKWMHAADGFILPSRNEPFGIALAEAMACGLPVISTKSGGPEVILRKEHGTLIEADNLDELANAIYKMLSQTSFDTSGYHEYINRYFGLTAYVNQHRVLYEQLLGQDISK